MNYCAWDYQDDYRYPPIPCNEPASVKIRGEWLCEVNADEAEALHESEPDDSSLDGMHEL